MIQDESRDPNGRIVYYVTMQITFLTCKFQNVERNLHCDLVHVHTRGGPCQHGFNFMRGCKQWRMILMKVIRI